ncbi:MAG: DciA family protein [bacterium]
MEKLGKLLKTRVKEIGIGRQADAMEILKLAENYINGSFSSAIAAKFRPASFRNGVIAISAISAPAASELKLHEKSLIDFINLKLKIEDVVQKIRILL